MCGDTHRDTKLLLGAAALRLSCAGAACCVFDLSLTLGGEAPVLVPESDVVLRVRRPLCCNAQVAMAATKAGSRLQVPCQTC